MDRQSCQGAMGELETEEGLRLQQKENSSRASTLEHEEYIRLALVKLNELHVIKNNTDTEKQRHKNNSHFTCSIYDDNGEKRSECDILLLRFKYRLDKLIKLLGKNNPTVINELKTVDDYVVRCFEKFKDYIDEMALESHVDDEEDEDDEEEE